MTDNELRAFANKQMQWADDAEALLREGGDDRSVAKGCLQRVRTLCVEVLKGIPPRGPCGQRHHAADCDCGGAGGDR